MAKTKTAVSPSPKVVQKQPVQNDPMGAVPQNIPVASIPGIKPNPTTDLRDHSALYCPPNVKFNVSKYSFELREFLIEAMRRYRKFKVPGTVNNLLFEKQLDDVLREKGLSGYDIKRVIRDGGGLAGL